MNAGMYSSATDMWETPQWLFDQLNAEFNFDLDVCAVLENTKCAKFFTPVENGLSQEWSGTCWCNPPYGREIHKWVEKAYESSRNGATVVMLVPARTDTKWFHDYIYGHADDVRLLRGRLKFGAAKYSAPFPSMVVVFKARYSGMGTTNEHCKIG